MVPSIRKSNTEKEKSKVHSTRKESAMYEEKTKYQESSRSQVNSDGGGRGRKGQDRWRLGVVPRHQERVGLLATTTLNHFTSIACDNPGAVRSRDSRHRMIS